MWHKKQMFVALNLGTVVKGVINQVCKSEFNSLHKVFIFFPLINKKVTYSQTTKYIQS